MGSYNIIEGILSFFKYKRSNTINLCDRLLILEYWIFLRVQVRFLFLWTGFLRNYFLQKFANFLILHATYFILIFTPVNKLKVFKYRI